MTEITTLIAGQPTYGYRRIYALLRCQRREQRASQREAGLPHHVGVRLLLGCHTAFRFLSCIDVYQLVSSLRLRG